MAKRFIDTELDDKPWFNELPCRLKCAVQYIFRKCDSAGIWEPNYVVAAVYVGEGGFKEFEILAIDGGTQFEKLPNGKIFVAGFCDFQYGQLSEDCKPHRPVIQKLKKQGLYERVLKGYQKGFQTLQEKDKDKEEEKVMDFGKSENLLHPETPIGAMVKLFTDQNAGYFLDVETDFAAMREVSEKIHKWLKLSGRYEHAENREAIRLRWGELITHVKADTHLSKYSISQINKHFSGITQSFSNGRGQSHKQPITGNGRQQGANQLLDSLRKDLESSAGGNYNP